MCNAVVIIFSPPGGRRVAVRLQGAPEEQTGSLLDLQRDNFQTRTAKREETSTKKVDHQPPTGSQVITTSIQGSTLRMCTLADYCKKLLQ